MLELQIWLPEMIHHHRTLFLKIGDLKCITFHSQLFALTLADLAGSGVEDGPMMSHVLPAEFRTDLLILLISQKKLNFAVPERVNLDILESSRWHLLRHFLVLVAGFKPTKRKNNARQIWIHHDSSSPKLSRG